VGTDRYVIRSVPSLLDPAGGSRPPTSRCAASVLGGAVGLASSGEPEAGRATSTLIGAAGAGLIASALFTTDPVSGYPPGTPDALTQPTRTGIAHNLSALPVFLGLSGALVTARGSWRGSVSFRGLQRWDGCWCADDPGSCGCGVRTSPPTGQPRGTVPTHQHHHRVHMAERTLVPRASANVVDRGTDGLRS